MLHRSPFLSSHQAPCPILLARLRRQISLQLHLCAVPVGLRDVVTPSVVHHVGPLVGEAIITDVHSAVQIAAGAKVLFVGVCSDLACQITPGSLDRVRSAFQDAASHLCDPKRHATWAIWARVIAGHRWRWN